MSLSFRLLALIALVTATTFLSACPPEPVIPGEKPSPHIGETVSFGDFTIDATEVTRKQYRAFLQAAVPLATDQDCAWNLDRLPDCEWRADERGDLPAVCLNWCDARDYCAWSGGRLCAGEWLSPESDEWYRACSAEGQFAYPYGPQYDYFACNGFDLGLEKARPVAQMESCQGGAPGLYDMSGNVIEWTAACAPGFGENVSCRLRGGGFLNDAEVLQCAYDFGDDTPRDLANEIIGFRCCR